MKIQHKRGLGYDRGVFGKINIGCRIHNKQVYFVEMKHKVTFFWSFT